MSTIRIVVATLLLTALLGWCSTLPSAARDWQLQGHQIRGGGGRGAQLRCRGIELPSICLITRVACGPAGFWISDSKGKITRFNDPKSAVGTSVGPGRVWAYPNLSPNRRTATVTLYLRRPGTSSATPAANLSGVWRINGNGYLGVVDFHSGVLHYDATGKEAITNYTYDSATGKVDFLRPGCNQRYTGVLRGSKITGTFTSGSGTYKWEATRK